MFSRRRSTATVLEREIADVGAKAAETVGDIAERAATIAREAGSAATPAIRSATQHSVEGLSRAAERASEALSETAERLAKAGEGPASDAAVAARVRIADATERLAAAVRPKPKRRHRVRRILIGGAIAGAIIGIVRSPLRGKITDRLFGPPPEDEPGSITLPQGEAAETASDSIEIRAEPVPPPAAPATQPEGVSSSASSEAADTTRS
jgi:hypothetical protein